VKTIVAYSYFRNAEKFRRQKELGWQITRVYDLHSVKSLEREEKNFNDGTSSTTTEKEAKYETSSQTETKATED